MGGAFSPGVTFGHPDITMAKTLLTRLFFKLIFKYIVCAPQEQEEYPFKQIFVPLIGLLCKGVGWVASVKHFLHDDEK